MSYEQHCANVNFKLGYDKAIYDFYEEIKKSLNLTFEEDRKIYEIAEKLKAGVKDD